MSSAAISPTGSRSSTSLGAASCQYYSFDTGKHPALFKPKSCDTLTGLSLRFGLWGVALRRPVLKYSSVPLCAAIVVLCGILTAGNAFALERLQPTTRAASGQIVQFNVYLPLRHTDQLEQLLATQQDPKSPNYHKWLTPAAFRARFG